MTTRVAIPRRVCQYKVTLSDHQAAGRRRKETETLLQITWGRGIDEECDKRFFYQGREEGANRSLEKGKRNFDEGLTAVLEDILFKSERIMYAA